LAAVKRLSTKIGQHVKCYSISTNRQLKINIPCIFIEQSLCRFYRGFYDNFLCQIISTEKLMFNWFCHKSVVHWTLIIDKFHDYVYIPSHSVWIYSHALNNWWPNTLSIKDYKMPFGVQFVGKINLRSSEISAL